MLAKRGTTIDADKPLEGKLDHTAARRLRRAATVVCDVDAGRHRHDDRARSRRSRAATVAGIGDPDTISGKDADEGVAIFVAGLKDVDLDRSSSSFGNIDSALFRADVFLQTCDPRRRRSGLICVDVEDRRIAARCVGL